MFATSEYQEGRQFSCTVRMKDSHITTGITGAATGGGEGSGGGGGACSVGSANNKSNSLQINGNTNEIFSKPVSQS